MIKTELTYLFFFFGRPNLAGKNCAKIRKILATKKSKQKRKNRFAIWREQNLERFFFFKLICRRLKIVTLYHLFPFPFAGQNGPSKSGFIPPKGMCDMTWVNFVLDVPHMLILTSNKTRRIKIKSGQRWPQLCCG